MSNNLFSSYDSEWTITVANSNASLQELQSTNGAFIGNGKVGFITAFDKIGVQRSIIGTTFDFNEEGLYTNNVSDGFDFTNIKLFDHNAGPETVSSAEFVSQSLNMFTGIATTNLQFTNTSNMDVVDVSYDLYPVRHLPYCTVQTLSFTPQQNMPVLEIFHQITCCQNVLVHDYNNNTIFNEMVNPNAGIYMLTGKGKFRDTDKVIAVASCYVAEGSNFNVVGFNRYASDRSTCYQKLILTDLTADTPYVVNILSTQMTGYDFRLPAEEVKRITVNVANVAQTSMQMSTLRQNHVNAWYNMWKSNITIEPKIGINEQETTDFNNVKRLLRYSMYSIWSSVREGIRTEVNPSNLVVLDSFGTLFWDGDLWFLPLLTLFRPDIAKSVLESRHRIIDRAIELAAGMGYSGAKMPYTHDSTAYINAPYWDLNGPMHIFNSATVCVAIWNFYRITLDKSWLLEKGFKMMKSITDFFVSRVEIDDDGSYHFRNVISFDNKAVDDNTLTNYLIKTAVKYAVQACWELNIVAPDTWSQVYYNIDLHTYGNDPYGIVMADAAASSGDSYKFLDMMIPLVNYYSETYYATNPTRDEEDIGSNLTYYSSRINSQYANNPLNNMILAWLNGSLINSDASSPASFNTAVLKVINENVQGLWGVLNMDNSDTQFQDISLGAMFALMLLTTVGTVRMTGVVTETKFYTSAMGFFVDNTSSMPSTWKNMKLTGLGLNGTTYNVLNKIYYP